MRDRSNNFVVYYESIKRELKTRPIYECRCDERRKTKAEQSTRLEYTGLLGELERLKTFSLLFITITTHTWRHPRFGFRFKLSVRPCVRLRVSFAFSISIVFSVYILYVLLCTCIYAPLSLSIYIYIYIFPLPIHERMSMHMKTSGISVESLSFSLSLRDPCW